MSHAQELIERVLREDPESRDNDRRLILKVWRLQKGNFEFDIERFLLHDAIMPETITRMRRKLQELGKYPASDAAFEARHEKFTKVKDYGFETPELINEILL